MTPHHAHSLVPALVLALATAPGALASPIPFTTTGTVTNHSARFPDLVTFHGTTGSFDPENPASVNLGTFVMSPAVHDPNTPNIDYANEPFQVTVSAGAGQSVTISGIFTGMVTPTDHRNDVMSGYIEAITPSGGQGLPFHLAPALGSFFRLSWPTGSSPAMTDFVVAAGAVPVPEPASVAVFAAAAGGLGLWRRRAAAR